MSVEVQSGQYLGQSYNLLFVKVDSVMMLTTSITTTSRMLSVFTDTAVTMAHMTTQLAGLLLPFQ